MVKDKLLGAHRAGNRKSGVYMRNKLHPSLCLAAPSHARSGFVSERSSYVTVKICCSTRIIFEAVQRIFRIQT